MLIIYIISITYDIKIFGTPKNLYFFYVLVPQNSQIGTIFSNKWYQFNKFKNLILEILKMVKENF